MSGPRIARIAVFAALVAVLGLTPAISLPGSSVPITAQTFAVMLAGLMLTPVDAFLALSVFVGLVTIAQLQLLPGGRGGIGVLATPSGGFVIGFPFAAAGVSLLAIGLRQVVGRERPRYAQVVAHAVAAIMGGIVVLYAIAVPLGALLGDIPMWPFLKTMTSFIPGDLLKAAAASVVAASAFRAAPYLRPEAAGARA